MLWVLVDLVGLKSFYSLGCCASQEGDTLAVRFSSMLDVMLHRWLLWVGGHTCIHVHLVVICNRAYKGHVEAEQQNHNFVRKLAILYILSEFAKNWRGLQGWMDSDAILLLSDNASWCWELLGQDCCRRQRMIYSSGRPASRANAFKAVSIIVLLERV